MNQPEAVAAFALVPGAAHFVVSEDAAYAPSGDGEHLYLEIEKEGLTTDQVAEALAKACGVRFDAVGYAGRKDRHAIARQWFSVHFGDETRLANLAEHLRGGRVAVLTVARHRNKLRLGHLAGNRFSLAISGGDAAARARLENELQRLSREGVRNRFGAQRFGRGGANLRAARAWGRGDHQAAVAALVDADGIWSWGDPLPSGFRHGPEGRVLGALRSGRDARAALAAAGDPMRKLLASSAQSAVFNAVLDARVERGLLHRLRVGDVGLTTRGAPFLVADADLDEVNRRAAPGTLDAIASAPLPGSSRLGPSPEVAAEERAWSAATDIDWAWLGNDGSLSSPGERRPVIIPFRTAPTLFERDGLTWLEFALPSGSYATEVLAQAGVGVPDDRSG